MAKVLIQIEDVADEVVVQTAIDPPLTQDKTIFSTAELIGLYMREHMKGLLDAAVKWSKEPEAAEPPVLEAPKLIVPDQGTLL